LGDRAGIARSLSKLGETLTWLGEFAQAQGPLEESRDIYDDLGLRDAAAFSEAMQAQAKTHLGSYDLACRQAQIALAHFQETDSQRGIGYAFLILGWATLAIAPVTQAQLLLQKSLAIYREIGQRDELAQTLTLLGYAAYRLGDLPLARQRLVEALQIAIEIRAFMPMMLALPAEALLSVAQGDLGRAAELRALAWRYPFVANSRWFEDMAGQELNAAIAALPPEVAAAAQEQGRVKALEPAIAQILSH
jgi:tetratricopeptide (TPR) repeat protein